MKNNSKTINKTVSRPNLFEKYIHWKYFLNIALLYTAGSISTLSASSLSEIGQFNGSTSVLSTCVAAYSSSGEPLLNAQGQAERYQVELKLAPASQATDQLTFELISASLSSQPICSGRYQDGSLTDSVLIENADASFAGKIYSLSMQLGSSSPISFALNVSPENFSETRNLTSNSIAFGAGLGSFQSTTQLTFNTVNLPSAYPLMAPECSDAEGDTTEVLVEISGQVVQRTAPAKEFMLNTSSIGSGNTEVRVRCSDISALTSQINAENFGKSTDYANGVVTLTVAADPNCSTSIESYMQKLTETFPTWTQLECFTQVLTRRELPNFYLQAGDTPPSESSTAAPLPFFEVVQNDVLFDLSWPESVASSSNLSEAPPYLIGGAVAYTAQEWDQKMRGMATYGIFLKQLGDRIQFNFFYPPSTGESGGGRIPITQNSGEFLAWWQNVYIPERVQLAQTAERVKAEYYQPWDIEPGQFVRSMGELWLDSLTEAEQISVTQQAIDLLYAAVRPEFTGTLTIINYDRYAATGNHWKQQNLSAWDQVHFALFTEADVEGTEAYLQEQLAGYLEMIQRDGITNWVLNEVTVDPARHQMSLDQFGMGTQFADIESQIYQAIFTAVANLQVPPKGLTITAGNIITPAAEALVRKNFAALSKMN